MATGDYTRLDRISTSEILEKLKKDDGDNTEYFYLYVSTAGIERKTQKRKILPPGQQTLQFQPSHTEDKSTIDTESTSDDTETTDDEQMEADEFDPTENSSQPIPPLDGNIVASQNNPLSSSFSMDKKARNDAMNKVHKVVLPKVLCSDGWKKVYDKDMKLTYRALYFNTITKHRDEDDIAYIQRVGKVRRILAEEADKVRKEYNVNFKINSLLSKPFLYDDPSLVELSMREGSTQEQPKQKRIDDYVK